MSAPDRERLMLQMGNGSQPSVAAPAKADSRLTPPQRPPALTGAIAGFEARPALRPFGGRLMESAGDYAMILDIPVPGDYDVGPGDSIQLQLFGKENRGYTLLVSREGVINLPDVGPLSVSGMTFESVSKAILERISKQKIGVEASVTMGQLRSIQVFMAGDVNYPGSFTTHALTTVTNALLAAGGVRATGSLRKVELRRGGRTVSHLDLYDILLRGNIQADLRLQSSDVIFVPPVGTRVAVDSGVNRPAIYELLKETTLGEVVRLAGGLLPTAFPAGSRLERAMPDGSRNATQVNMSKELGSRFAVKDGDILSIPATLARIDGTVRLAGAVERPGEYEWRPAMRLNELLTSPTLLKRGAWRLLGFIGRSDPLSGATSYVPFSPAEVFSGKEIIVLEDQDEVYLLGAEDVEFLSSANVQYVLAGQLMPTETSTGKGRIAVANTQLLENKQNFGKDAEAVFQGDFESAKRSNAAGGVRETSCPGIVELATIVGHESSRRYRSALFLSFSEKTDTLSLKSLPCPDLYTKFPRLLPEVLEHTVVVRGEVKAPGLLPASPGVLLQILIRAAGGNTRDADLDSIEVLRPISLPDGGRDVKRLIMKQAQLAEERMHSGDIILVPKRFTMQDSGTVRLSGEVRKPGVLDIRRGDKLSDVLNRAGGLTPFAYAYGAVFQRARVKEEKRLFYQRAGIEMQNSVLLMSARQKRTTSGSDGATFAAMKSLAEDMKKIEPSGRIVVEADPVVLQVHPELDVVLEPGDDVVIPKRPSHVLVMGEVLNPGAVQFKSGLHADDYLRAAGGVARTGDESYTYMILPNGSAEPLKVASWNAQPTPVAPGSVIYVPRDPLPLDSTALIQTMLEIAKDIALTAAALNSITD